MRRSWSSKKGFVFCCVFFSSDSSRIFGVAASLAASAACDEKNPWAMQRNGAYGESSQCSLHGIWHPTRPLGQRPFATYLHETDIMYGMYQAGRDTQQWFIRRLVTHLTLFDLYMILDIGGKILPKKAKRMDLANSKSLGISFKKRTHKTLRSPKARCESSLCLMRWCSFHNTSAPCCGSVGRRFRSIGIFSLCACLSLPIGRVYRNCAAGKGAAGAAGVWDGLREITTSASEA